MPVTPPKGLTLDIEGYIVMTHGSCLRRSKSRASEPGLGTAPTRGRCRGGVRVSSALPHFQAPGLSVCSTGSSDDVAHAGWRRKDPVHSQAFAEFSSAASSVRCFDRADTQRDCEPCLNDGPASRARAWLRAISLEAFVWSIGLIVCLKRSWSKSFRLWHQQSSGSLAQSPKPRRP